MKFNRILSSALLVVMIFMTFVTVLPFTAEAAYTAGSSASTLTAKEIKELVIKSYSGDIAYPSSQAKLDAENKDHLDIVEQGDYIIYEEDTDNKGDVLFVTDKCHIYRARVSDFELSKPSFIK